MMLQYSVVAATLLACLACGPSGKPSTTPASSAPPSTATAESCKKLAGMLCERGGRDEKSCEGIQAAIVVLPPKSCDEALKDPAYIEARIAERKAVCTTLMEKLCSDLGGQTQACAMVREQAPKFDGSRCQQMFDQYAEVLADLQQFEAASKPLGVDEQKAIAAADAPAFGPADAKVTLVLFSDFQCPYCSKAAAVVQHVKTHFADQVRFVFRQFPLSFHKNAKLAAEAALLAHDSGKFWEYHDQLFANQENLDLESLMSYGKLVGLDLPQMRAKLGQHAYDSRVMADIALGERVHVNGTPTLFINGRRSQNATSVEVVAGEVAAALAEDR